MATPKPLSACVSLLWGGTWPPRPALSRETGCRALALKFPGLPLSGLGRGLTFGFFGTVTKTRQGTPRFETRLQGPGGRDTRGRPTAGRTAAGGRCSRGGLAGHTPHSHSLSSLTLRARRERTARGSAPTQSRGATLRPSLRANRRVEACPRSLLKPGSPATSAALSPGLRSTAGSQSLQATSSQDPAVRCK